MSVPSRLRVFCERERWMGRIAVRMCTENGLFEAEPLKMRPIKKEGEIVEPTFHIDMMAAQSLMDNLWECGLRPSEGTGSAGAMQATERHLEDMRKLVFEVKK